MRAVAIEWRAVELNAATFAPVPGHGTQSVDLAMYTDDLVAVSDALVQLLPNVRRLNFGGTKSPPLDSALYGRLAGHYAEQLQHIYCKYPISVPPGHPFQRLQSVWIIDDRVADYELPQMASGELVDLALSCGPVNHSWASFSTDSDSRVIEFTKLKKLSTSYLGLYKVGGIAVRHRDGHPWILRLPELKRLSISCRESMCPLLEYAVLPPRMVSIAIELTLAAFQQQADVVLPATKSLSLKVSQWSGGNPGGFSVINRLVDNARRSGSVELMINDHTLAVHPESITCTALTRLVVAGPASIDTMLALIKQMPRLSELAFGSLTPGHIQTDISIPDADQAAAVEPLSTSLRVLEMAYDPEPVSSDLAVALAQCMLLRIPSLVKLHTSDTPKDLVLDFVDEYAEHYPRLEGVELFFGY
ncbi:hypothetical protein H4R19_000297 [Coemansia spiralis]|nr:hypothetical protein H4R19_000297 [Coemansia spiralis]